MDAVPTPVAQTPEQDHRDAVLAHIMALEPEKSMAVLTAADKLFEVVMSNVLMLNAFVLVAAEVAASQSTADNEAPRIALINTPQKIVT